MKQLGKVSHISNRSRVILKSDQTPGFGLPVFTNDNKKFGTVYDVFGPTKGQYLENRIGETLFIPSKKIEKRGRRKRQNK